MDRILLIDDDPLILKSMANLLKSKGFAIETAKNGTDAVTKINQSEFDLIVSDIRMPEEDGIFVMKKLKRALKEKNKSQIPFLFITGYASEDAPINAMKLGADDYILKPFDNDQFITAVKKSLAKSKTQDLHGSSLSEMCLQIKGLIDEYQDKNEKEIYANKELAQFLSRLRDHLLKIEKQLIEFDSK